MTRTILALALLLLACGPGRIAEYPQEQPMNADEIRAALAGTDFRLKNAAREQLTKLTPEEQVALFTQLLKSEDSPTRLLAVVELSRLPAEVHTPLLKEVAANDPDEEVREFAAAALGEEPGEEEGAAEAE